LKQLFSFSRKSDLFEPVYFAPTPAPADAAPAILWNHKGNSALTSTNDWILDTPSFEDFSGNASINLSTDSNQVFDNVRSFFPFVIQMIDDLWSIFTSLCYKRTPELLIDVTQLRTVLNNI
jgi:hypothetical protein